MFRVVLTLLTTCKLITVSLGKKEEHIAISARKSYHLPNFYYAPDYAGPVLFPINVSSDSHFPCCEPYIGVLKEQILIEWDVWAMIEAFVTPNSRIMEFGARYGTTSCVISRASGNMGHSVSIEIDDSVRHFLMANREYHQCNFHVFMGFVGAVPLKIDGDAKGYATNTEVTTDKSRFATIREVENIVGYKINTLVIDCEGCIHNIITPELLDQVSLIVIEVDQPDRVPGGYESFYSLFRQHGLEMVWKSRCTWSKDSWCKEMTFVVFKKGGVSTDTNACENFKKLRTLSDDLLICLPIS